MSVAPLLCGHAQPACSPDKRLLYCVGIIMIMCGDTCCWSLIDVGMRNLRVPDEKTVVLRGNNYDYVWRHLSFVLN